MPKYNISMFDWDGNLKEQLTEDEKTFGVKFKESEPPCMGNYPYTIEGPNEKISEFLKFYDLELDDDQVMEG